MGRTRAGTPPVLMVAATDVTGLSTNDVLPTPGTTLWAPAGSYDWDFTPGTVTIVSDDAADAAPGIGAHTMLVVGLDTTGAEIQEFVILNGLTPVVTTQTFMRINNGIVLASGTSQRNQGSITGTISGSQVFHIHTLMSRVDHAMFTIPYTWRNGAMVPKFRGSMHRKTGTASLAVWYRFPGGSWAVAASFSVSGAGGYVEVDVSEPVVLPAGTDVDMRLTDLTANDVGVFAMFSAYRGAY